MYAYIDGKLAFKCPTYVIIEAGGVGYQILISLHTFSQINDVERCKLHIFQHLKEDAHTLYGFAEESEKRLFMHLISVSGIGPSTCRMMLSSISPLEIQQAIVQADLTLIQRIKGIGAKSAQRIVLELQDKLKKEGSDTLLTAPVINNVKDEALSALMMLGFGKTAAEKTLDQILKANSGDMSVEQLIKAALRNL